MKRARETRRRLGLVVVLVLGGAAGARGITLDAALARTLAHNPQIAQARAAVEEATGERLLFHARALPNLEINLPTGVQGGDRAGQDANEPFAFVEADLQQPIFDAAISASSRRGDLAVLIATQRLNVAIVTRLHAARIAFYTALHDSALEQFGRSQQRRLDENRRSEEARYAAGAVTRGALASATLQARELDPQIEEAHRAFGAAQLELATALGANLEATAQLPSPDGQLTFAPVEFSLDKATAAALERRADLRLARLLLQATREDERIAASGSLPRLEFTLLGRYIPEAGLREANSGTSQRADDIITSEISPGLGYTWRVLDNGEVGGAVLRARALREINALRLRQLERSVGRELAALQNNLRAIAARHASLLQAVEVAEKNVAAVEQSWQQGLASQLEFRTAETGLLATRRGLLDATYAQNVARAEWDRATGRYFQFANASPKQAKGR